MTFFGPYLVACALLVAAGVAKALRPDTTARAMAVVLPGVGPARLRGAVRLVASAEAALGVAAAVAPARPLAGAVAVSYLAFAAVVAFVRLRHGALASCGCFATPDTPATWLHAAVNVLLAAAAGAVSASASSDSLLTVLSRQPLHGGPLLVTSAIGAWLSYQLLVGLARLSAVRREMTGTAADRGETGP